MTFPQRHFVCFILVLEDVSPTLQLLCCVGCGGICLSTWEAEAGKERKFEASFSDIVRPCVKNKKITERRKKNATLMETFFSGCFSV
jgi:hypothetical protein